MEQRNDRNLPHNFVSKRINPNEKVEQQDEVINSLTLELRNPVTTLKSNVQLLKKYCLMTEDLFIEDSFALCECALNDMLRFFDCIRFLSESYQGILRLQKSNFELTLFLKQIFEEINNLNLDASRIQVNLKVYSLFIITDKYLLQRILINLLANALKFSNSSVELIINDANQDLNITIRDYGIGIPSDELTNVFRPFARAGNAKMIPGTGLGLAIVSRAVNSLEGSLYVKSIPGQETEFKVIIPLEVTGMGTRRAKRSISLKRKQYN